MLPKQEVAINSAGEDFDFILGEQSRQLKAWIPKGMPTDEAR